MSRLLVKNIPKYITEDRFKSHFEKIGPVTDAKIIKTKCALFAASPLALSFHGGFPLATHGGSIRMLLA